MSNRPRLRTPKNADLICALLVEGHTLRQVARKIGLQTESGIVAWGNDEAAPEFRERYARAMERRWERMADELVEISDADYTGPNGLVDNAAVQQARLKSDNRKWLLSKMLPKRYGDKITQEITGDPDAPLVTRIELVPVASPGPRPDPDVEAVSVGEAGVSRLRAIPSR